MRHRGIECRSVVDPKAVQGRSGKALPLASEREKWVVCRQYPPTRIQFGFLAGQGRLSANQHRQRPMDGLIVALTDVVALSLGDTQT
jgi:hypothetical protein